MQQLSLWDVPAKQSVKVPIFRVVVKDKLYTREGGELLEEWIETTDFVLFTANGLLTTEEVAASYVIARRQGIRVQYAVWKAHCPELFDKEKIFEIDAGHAYESEDAATWKKFTHANNVTVIKNVTHRSALGTGVLG